MFFLCDNLFDLYVSLCMYFQTKVKFFKEGREHCERRKGREGE